MQINDDKWTAIILVKSFIFFNTTDVNVTLHHFLIKIDWSLIKLKLTFNLHEHKRQNDDKQVLQYCFFDTSNVILIHSIMSDKLDRIKIATIRILNSAHIDERNYEYNDRFRDIILSQNLRIKFTSILFKNLNFSTTLAEWNIKLNKFQMSIMQYFQNLFNDFDLIKKLFEIEKTLMNVVITMLLLKLSKKVKVLSSFNNTADTFILKLNEQLQWLKNKDIILTDKKIVRFYSQFTERQIVTQDSYTSHSVNNDFAQQWWNVFHKLSDVFYDQLIHQIIDQSKKTLHDIRDYQYKLHQISLDTLLLKVTSLSDHLMNKTQSQSQQSEQSDKQHETQDSSIVQINNEEVDVTYKNFKSDDNSLDVNYEDLNFHVTRQFLKRDHEFKHHMLQRIINVKLNRMNNETERDAVIKTFCSYFQRIEMKKTVNMKDQEFFQRIKIELSVNILEHDVSVVVCTLINFNTTMLKRFKEDHTVIQKVVRVENAKIFITMTHSNDSMHMFNDDE